MAKHVIGVVYLDFVGLRQCPYCQQVVSAKAMFGYQLEVWNNAIIVLPTSRVESCNSGNFNPHLAVVLNCC